MPLSIQPFSGKHFWQEVLLLTKDELGHHPDLQKEIDALLAKEMVTKDDIRQVLRQLGKQNKFLVLLVDDYDTALRSHVQYTETDILAFLSECRNLAYHCKERKYFSMVVTSSRRLNEFNPQVSHDGSPWYNHYLFQPLKPFSEKEATELIGYMPMPTAIREGIRELADGHPALLQIAGSLLYRELRTGQIPSAESFATDFESITRHFFQNTWKILNEVEQILLMLIALSSLKGRLHKKNYDLNDVDLILSQSARELVDLEERGVIICSVRDGKHRYRFASSLMERWVIQEIANSDEETLQERQRVFLHLMSNKQAKQVTAAIRWLWQHKNQVPSILEWIGKVAAAIPKGAIQG